MEKYAVKTDQAMWEEEEGGGGGDNDDDYRYYRTDCIEILTVD